MLRSLMTVSGFTLMSRVLGLLRDALIGRVLGAGAVADSFFAGFRFPNMFRRIFGEGAFNAAFVPMFGRELNEEGHEKSRQFASQAFSLLAWTLLIGTVVLIPLMRWVIAIFTPGFLLGDGQSFSWPWLWEMVKYPHGTEKFELTVGYTRIMFSYLMCMALAAHLSGVLNTLKVFAAPAFAPVLLNILMITGLGVIVPVFGFDADVATCGLVLSWTVFVAGIFQMSLLYFSCRKKDMSIHFVWPRWTPKMRKLLVLMGPGVVAAGIQQLNLAVGMMIASAQEGALSWIYYGERIFQLPLGMIGIAFGIVLLPEITRLVRSNQEDQVTGRLVSGYTFSMLLTLPAMVAMIVIPESIISTLFENGDKFKASDTLAVSGALRGFAFGLPAYILIKVLQPAYFAREDTRRPMFMAGVTVVVNIVGSLLLFPWLGFVGIAIATSISGWVNYFLLYRGLNGLVPMSGALSSQLMRTLLASLVMGVVLFALQYLLSGWLHAGFIQKVIALTVLITIGFFSYVIAALGLKATTMADLKAGFVK